jgi:hypothetical protein
MSTVTSLLGGKASRIAKQVDDLAHETGESLHGAASSIRQSGQQGVAVVTTWEDPEWAAESAVCCS